MTDSADLELSLHRHDQLTYEVEFRFMDSDPQSQAEVRLGAGQKIHASLDFDKLDEHFNNLDMRAYGQTLTAGLFGDDRLKAAFAQARTATERAEARLRLRLVIGPSALELHRLRWETLNDPLSGVCLSTDQNVYFSRYLSSLDWRPVRLRSRGELKALAAIAAPNGLEKYQLAPIDKNVELETAQKGLGSITIKPLESVTIDNLILALSGEQYDILYLAAHGAFVNGEPQLWLEDDHKNVARLSGSELATRIRELEYRPRLIVLASCQSAGKGEGEALAALGPRLAEAGIPAALAIQDNVSMETVTKFMPIFFAELYKDGQIDRALTVARGQVRAQHDWWTPVLFMRLKSGRLWYTPGFADAKKGFQKFPAQIQNIKNKHFTPILGPGLVEGLFGSPQEIARNWAEAYHYPLAPQERESLPQVSQYLTINQQKSFPYEDLINHLRVRLQDRFRNQLTPELLNQDAALSQVIDSIGKILRAQNPDEPHRALAELPVEVYLTTNADTLLEGALEDAKKHPQTRTCPWNEYTAEQESQRDDETYTVDRPLVYHLFGLWKDRPSIVLTEDNYFDFLIGTAKNKTLIPLQVKKAMTDSGLLFLGFQTNEWNFRVLFRSILSLPGQRYDEYANIAAQIEPEDGRILEPERAREYLEQYFYKGHKLDLSIFWGTPDEFIKELMRYWRTNA